jgi:hypothetical protein
MAFVCVSDVGTSSFIEWTAILESAAYVYKQCYQPLCGGLRDCVLLNKVKLNKLMMHYLSSFQGILNEDITRFHADTSPQPKQTDSPGHEMQTQLWLRGDEAQARQTGEEQQNGTTILTRHCFCSRLPGALICKTLRNNYTLFSESYVEIKNIPGFILWCFTGHSMVNRRSLFQDWGHHYHASPVQAHRKSFQV